MVRSLQLADSWLSESRCIVSYSDIFYESSAISLLSQSDAKISVLYDSNWHSLWRRRFENPLDDAETFVIDNNFRLEEIGMQAKNYSRIMGQYMGVIKIDPEAWAEINCYLKSVDDEYADGLQMTSLLQVFIKEHKALIKGVPYPGIWGEVDSAKDLQLYEKTIDVLEKRDSSGICFSRALGSAD